MKKLLNTDVVAFISLLAAVGGIAVLVHMSGNKYMQKLSFEVDKFLIQFVLLTVAGGILLQTYNRRRERAEATQEFRRTVLRSLFDAFTDTKKARRIIRAKCDKPAPPGAVAESIEIPLAAYEAQMENILDIESQLDLLKREVQVFAAAFTPDRAEKLKTNIDKMYKYLDELTKEYEGGARQFMNDKQCIPITKLPRLEGFTRSGKAGDYRPGLRDLFFEVFRCIRAEELGL
jgi:hypothetical protein